MGWTDDLANAVQGATQATVCGIYKISPVNALAKLAGDAGFSPGQAYTGYFNGLCGNPDAPPPATFGRLGQRLGVRVFDGLGRIVGNRSYWNAPAALVFASAYDTNGEGQPILATIYSADYPQGQGGVLVGTFFYGYLSPLSHIWFLVDDPDATPLPPNGGSGYPPLTDQQNSDLEQVLRQLAAVRNTQGYQNGKLSALDAKADALVNAADAAAAKQDTAQDSLNAILALLQAIKAELDLVKTDVSDIKQRLGSGEGLDDSGGAWGTLTTGVNDCIASVAKVIAYTGLKDGAYHPADFSGDSFNTIMDAFNSLLVKLDLGRSVFTNLGGTATTLTGLVNMLNDLRNRIGYYVTSVGVAVPGQDPKDISDVQGAIQDLALFNGNDGTVIQGFEKGVIDRPTLHIVMNSKGGLAPQGYFSIPNPKIGLTKEVILLAIGEQVRGAYYCQLELDNRRQVSGWFESEAAGLAYLTKVASLSSLPIKEGSLSATHRPGASPTTFADRPLKPVKASLYASSSKGQPYNVIFLQQ